LQKNIIMKKERKLLPKGKEKKDILKEKKIAEQDFIDEKTDLEDHDDPEYPFEEKVKSPSATEAEKENNAK
jgi:hypothetical protein